MHVKFWLESPKGKTNWENDACKWYRAISYSDPCNDMTILSKNPINALVHINTTLFTHTLLDMSALKGPCEGSTDTFREQVRQNMGLDVNFIDVYLRAETCRRVKVIIKLC
jgi:hypothetical protein